MLRGKVYLRGVQERAFLLMLNLCVQKITCYVRVGASPVFSLLLDNVVTMVLPW